MSCDRRAASYVIKGAVHIIDLPTRKKHVRMNFNGEVKFQYFEDARAWLRMVVFAKMRACQREWELPEKKIILKNDTIIARA